MENENPGNIPPDQKDEDIVPKDDEQDVEKFKTAISTLSAQKKHWREKAVDPETGKSYKDLLAEARKPTPPPNPPPTADLDGVKESIGKLEKSEEKRSFQHQEGLSPEEVDFVFATGTGLGISSKDALAKPYVKAAIDAMRAQKRAESNIPGSSNRAPRVDGKTWNEMDDTEKRKNFANVAGSFKR